MLGMFVPISLMPCHQLAERNIELALEGPQLVQAFNLEMKVVVADGNIDHVLKTMIPRE